MGGVESLVHTVCACSVTLACSVTPGFLGLWKLADTTPQYCSVCIIILSFISRVQLKMVVLSEESGIEAKPVLMVFRHVDARKTSLLWERGYLLGSAVLNGQPRILISDCG